MGTLFYRKDKTEAFRTDCIDLRLALFEGDILHSIEPSRLPPHTATWRISYVFKLILNPKRANQSMKQAFFKFYNSSGSFRKSREIEGEIKQATILREGDHWYISLSTEQEVADPIPAPILEEKAVGIDMGLKTFATLAKGIDNQPTYISNPRFFTQYLQRLRVLSKRLSKKVKFSKNWLKTKRQLSKLHARIKHCREDFAHKLSTAIVKSHDIICVEGLNIANLLEKGITSLSRSIADASWRFFLRCLEYKTKAQGKHFVETGQYFPSTQTCSACGARKKMELQDREYQCPNCSMVMDRDLNSAILEKAAGMSVLKACGATP